MAQFAQRSHRQLWGGKGCVEPGFRSVQNVSVQHLMRCRPQTWLALKTAAKLLARDDKQPSRCNPFSSRELRLKQLMAAQPPACPLADFCSAALCLVQFQTNAACWQAVRHVLHSSGRAPVHHCLLQPQQRSAEKLAFLYMVAFQRMFADC